VKDPEKTLRCDKPPSKAKVFGKSHTRGKLNREVTGKFSTKKSTIKKTKIRGKRPSPQKVGNSLDRTIKSLQKKSQSGSYAGKGPSILKEKRVHK